MGPRGLLREASNVDDVSEVIMEGKGNELKLGTAGGGSSVRIEGNGRWKAGGSGADVAKGGSGAWTGVGSSSSGGEFVSRKRFWSKLGKRASKSSLSDSSSNSSINLNDDGAGAHNPNEELPFTGELLLGPAPPVFRADGGGRDAGRCVPEFLRSVVLIIALAEVLRLPLGSPGSE